MKTPLIVALLFVLGVGAGVLVKTHKFNKNNSKETTTVTYPNNTVPGNVTDDLTKAIHNSNYEQKEKAVLKQSLDAKRVVYFNSDFNYYSVEKTINRLKELEKKSSDPIWMLIDSPGGDVIAGGMLIAQMQASKAPVYTVCTRLCASMAAITHSYGAKRYALDQALLMYHPASAGVAGQVPNMVSLLTTITRYIDKMNSNIVQRSKLSSDEFSKLVAYELWIDSEDALEKGLVDNIVSLDVPNRDLNQPAQVFEESECYNTDVKTPKAEFKLISPYADTLWTTNGHR